jgi:predicted house-cleaning noncanonical NTP pyrophosphatase (MazG superfamily)/8-oxo-dGTP pyrophosphatase MutT (NUDIX family)
MLRRYGERTGLAPAVPLTSEGRGVTRVNEAEGAPGDVNIPGSLARVLADVAAERAAQDAMWGPQEFPDGTGPERTAAAEQAKSACRDAWGSGELTWRHILTEEYFEALAESDPPALRAELVQTAAVAVKWIQSLDRRHGYVRHRPRRGGGRREKLVRDGVPGLIRSTGGEPPVRVAADGEYDALLRAKLYEEAGEYVASGDPEELADLLEVVRTLARGHGLDPDRLERLRAGKAVERGGFDGRQVLDLPGQPDGEDPALGRHSVRALLLDGDDLVLFRRTRPDRDLYWTTPGGGIEAADADPEAALRRELDEELGAVAGELRQVFVLAEQTPVGDYLQTFYVARLVSMDLSRRHGPEIGSLSRGRYDAEWVPCTPEAIAKINLRPHYLADYLRVHARELPALLPGAH